MTKTKKFMKQFVPVSSKILWDCPFELNTYAGTIFYSTVDSRTAKTTFCLISGCRIWNPCLRSNRPIQCLLRFNFKKIFLFKTACLGGCVDGEGGQRALCTVAIEDNTNYYCSLVNIFIWKQKITKIVVTNYREKWVRDNLWSLWAWACGY